MRHLFTLTFLTLGLSWPSATVFSQNASDHVRQQMEKTRNYGKFHYLQVRYHRGSNATSSRNETVANLFQSSAYNGYDIRMGWVTTGEKPWQRVLRYPEYGFGISGFFYSVREVENLIGDPSGVYGFIGVPLHKGKGFRFSIDLDLAAGLTYDLNPYDPITNPYNDAVGSRILYYFDFDLDFKHKLSQRLDLIYGLTFIHFSNGRTRTPNLGVNMSGINVGLRYHFNPLGPYVKKLNPDIEVPIRPDYVLEMPPKAPNYFFGNAWTSFGTAAINPPQDTTLPDSIPQNQAGPNYLTHTTGIDYNYRIGRLFAFGLAATFHFDAGWAVRYEGNRASFWQKTNLSAGANFLFNFNRLAIMGQAMLYVAQTEELKQLLGSFHFRAGGRVHINRNLFAQFTLKTRNGGIADWVEFGIGYSWRHGKGREFMEF